MSEIIRVGLGAHRNLHDGHRAIFNYARSLGDVKAQILIDELALSDYCLTGRIRTPQSVNLSNMKKELDALHIPQNYKSLANTIKPDEQKRQHIYKAVSGLVDLCKDQILLESYRDMAITRLMFRRLAIPAKGPKSYTSVVHVTGPEWIGFFMKSAVNMITADERIEIFPTLIKDKQTGLRLQARLEDHTFPAHLESEALQRLHPAAAGARFKFKVGLNKELVKELNLSYAHRPWKWLEIAVWEGGIVPGRLEVVQFVIRVSEGLLVVEDSWYEG